MASTQALVKAVPLCVRCQEPVPQPLSVCLRCGAGPLVADPGGGGEWSVELAPVPAMKLRKEVAQVCAQLLPGIDEHVLERRIAEGQQPLWLTGGLSERAAGGLVDRLKAMHAPARAFRGAPEARSGMAAVLNLWTGLILAGGVVLGIVLWKLWLIPIVAVIAVVVGYTMGRKTPDRPFARADTLTSGDAELDAQVQEAVSVRGRLSEELLRRYDRITTAVRDLLLRLGNDEDAVGYVAGGTSGTIGRETMHVLKAATHVGGRLALAARDPNRVAVLEGGLDQLADAASHVRDDLRELAQDPDAEPDIAGRLDENAKRLASAAEYARTL